MLHFAFVTCSSKPEIAIDDWEVANELISLGIQVQAVPWDGDPIDWTLFDGVILRSCWNYHLQPQKFMNWLDALEKQRIRVFNPVTVVRSNLHKSYLLTLQQKGVLIPETQLISQGSSVNLNEIMNRWGWEKAVVKPAISATAWKTFVAHAGNTRDEQSFQNSLLQCDLLVQNFIPEIGSGELSLIFFQKKFSHAVIKKPKAGDFRVQDNFGGTIEPMTPPVAIIKQARSILNHVAEPLFYARVDGLVINNQFLLMELELIEPVLFFKQAPAAAQLFTKALFNL